MDTKAASQKWVDGNGLDVEFDDLIVLIGAGYLKNYRLLRHEYGPRFIETNDRIPKSSAHS